MRKLITATGLAVAIVEGFTLSPTSLADSERPGPVELGLSGTTGSREDFRYTAGSETLIPISIEAGAIVVEGSINGHGPFPFIFDTGAQDAMTPETVAALGLQADGTGSIEDSGGHVVAISFTRVGALRLCDAQITDQPFLVLPLPQYLTDRGKQLPIAGFIGYELLTRFLVRLDYDDRTLTLRPGSDFRHHENGIRVPLLFRDKTPAVPAVADGIPGIFEIDTGSTGALTLRRQFVEDHGFEARHPSALRIKSFGASGLFETMLTRLDAFEVAGSRIDHPATRFPSVGRDGLTLNDIDGSIGYEILRQFVITFDYRKGEAWFERSTAFGVRTGQGGAGFQAVRVDGAGFRVLTVLPDTAAATGGLQVGDLITEINGRSTSSMSLSEMAELMRRPVGTLVHLSTVRDGNLRAISLTLKDVLP